MVLKIVIAGTAVVACFAAAAAIAETAAGSTDAGKQVYQRANCVGCHKWSGSGGGGYGGAALSLRQTQLSKDEIVEIVKCGRPGTGMPHFTVDAYQGGACYGLRPDDVKDIMPPAANVVLQAPDIEAVAGYVVADIKGKGPPTLADCVAFFGESSRACDVLRPADGGSRRPMPTPSTTQ